MQICHLQGKTNLEAWSFPEQSWRLSSPLLVISTNLLMATTIQLKAWLLIKDSHNTSLLESMIIINMLLTSISKLLNTKPKLKLSWQLPTTSSSSFTAHFWTPQSTFPRHSCTLTQLLSVHPPQSTWWTSRRFHPPTCSSWLLLNTRSTPQMASSVITRVPIWSVPLNCTCTHTTTTRPLILTKTTVEHDCRPESSHRLFTNA